MLEIYSKNITVASNTPIPLNNVTLIKGCTVENTGVSTIQFNRCGIYEVCCNATAVPTAETPTGEISIQLEKDAVLQPQAQSSFTAADDEVNTLSFTTLVQVTHNNGTGCCCTPTRCEIINTGLEATFDSINVVVTKIC